MPTYDYHCPANGRTLEVMHKMDQHVSTWEELCALAELDTGDTAKEAPVERVLNSAPGFCGSSRSSSEASAGPGCATGACPFVQ